MPRPPASVPDVALIGSAVFSPLAARLPRGEASYPLHVGDTWLEPLDVPPAPPGAHRYSATQGIPELVEALVEKVRARNGIPCTRESIVVVGGATAGLAAAVGAVAGPGEEVLILAPFWPLIRGIVRCARAIPVEVPFFDRVASADEAVAAVRRNVSPRTAALYVSTPSNPTGRVIPPEWLEAMAAWARRENLWILSDEVYEELVYRGRHVSIGRLAPERTISVFSFSKAYAMAGDRVGYVVAPEPVASEVHKVTTHTMYCAPVVSQWRALHVLGAGGAWLERARALYREAGERSARRLGVETPAGSTFLFVDVRAHLDGRGAAGFLEDCAEEGVLVAPGRSSGDAYDGWIRLCFTSCRPEAVDEAVRRLAKRMGR